MAIHMKTASYAHPSHLIEHPMKWPDSPASRCDREGPCSTSTLQLNTLSHAACAR